MIDDGDGGAVGGMKIVRGNSSTRRKPAALPLYPLHILYLTWDRTLAIAVGSRRLTAWAMARPVSSICLLGLMGTAWEPLKPERRQNLFPSSLLPPLLSFLAFFLKNKMTSPSGKLVAQEYWTGSSLMIKLFTGCLENCKYCTATFVVFICLDLLLQLWSLLTKLLKFATYSGSLILLANIDGSPMLEREKKLTSWGVDWSNQAYDLVSVGVVMSLRVSWKNVLKSTIFWDITPWSPLRVNGRFGGTSPPSWGSSKPSFHPGILLGLFGREDGGDMFFRNVGWLPTGYTALYPRRQYSS
jgi:hypothetical protein